MFVEKYCCTRPILEDVALTINFKVHAETCYLYTIIVSSLGCLGCLVFPSMVLSNFLGGCSTQVRASHLTLPQWFRI